MPDEIINRDPHLNALVRTINMTKDNRCSTTLFIGGRIITGQAISIYEFYNRYADVISSVASDSIRKQYQRLADDALAFANRETPDQEGEATDETEDDGPYFIHMDHVSTWVGLQRMPVPEETVMRFKISAIDGYCLGEIATE